ncbi:protein kinase [Aerosakkonema sp. BLCC-F183]|uniref:protein kinase domain-containing protein n=1 Tax=Aerosakkonema sp. BLCC-F183 TaxID=3342834 RepID=UPI0035B6FDD0
MFGTNLVGQTLQGRYRITQKLGEGGFGETYLAIDTCDFNEPCVVKRLKAQSQTNIKWVQQAFEQEAQMLKKLGKHPQIPKLLAYFPEQQEFFLVQEYIEGNNLRTQINIGSRWNENQVIFLLQYILEVLEFVQQNGVIHRDIKPENIIIQKKDNKIILIDFGAVKQVSTQVFNTHGQVVATTVGVGTPGYMPIEQMRGHPALGSDVYAVGMIGIEALTGILPSNIPIDPNNLELVWRNQAQVRNDVANVLDKMVRYHPSKRYQSASEALKDIRKLTITKPLSQPPIPPPPNFIKYAGFSTRLVADIIDKTILIVGSVMWDLITQTPTTNGEEFLGRIIVAYVILGFLYCPVMESSNFQGTLGKKLLGIVVTDINGNQLSFEQATKRHSSKLLSYLTLFIGFFMAGWTIQKQALHDKICQTLVVRK